MDLREWIVKFKTMSSKEKKLDYLWARCLWLVVRAKAAKDCEDKGEGTKGQIIYLLRRAF
jgi:hypothetical protein